MRHRSYARYHFIEAVALILISTTYATPIHAACVSRHGRGMFFAVHRAPANRHWLTPVPGADGSLPQTTPPISGTMPATSASSAIRISYVFDPPPRIFFPSSRGRGVTPRAEGKPSIEVPTAELPGIVTADEALVHHIILLIRVATAHAELRSLPKEAARQYFQQYLQLPDKIQEMQAEAAKGIATADVYELRYQDLQQAIDCLNVLASDPGQTQMNPAISAIFPPIGRQGAPGAVLALLRGVAVLQLWILDLLFSL